MYKRIAIGISSIALSLALIVSGLILQSPSIAFAQNVIVDSDSEGLVVIPLGGKFFELNNMGPGDMPDDLKTVDEDALKGLITVTNSYTEPYEVFLSAKRTSPIPEGADLYDMLMLEVKFRGGTLNEKTELMKGFATSEISLGTFAPGDTQNIELGVSLPGEEMGNEYQGTSVDVLWTFRAVVPEPGPGPGPGPGPDDDDDDEDEPEDVPEEPVPLAVVEPVPEEIIPEETVPLAVPEVEEDVIEEEPVPLAVPKLPRTGGMAPIFFYSAGVVLLGAGVVILRRKDDDDEK
jgi:LPXTG-motif cell wall-anchored protein